MIFFSRKKIGSIDPTLTDVDSAVVWMITKDLRRKLPALFDDVKAWLKVLHMVEEETIPLNIKSFLFFSLQYYPGSENMKSFLADLIAFINDRPSITGKDLQTYINSTSVKNPWKKTTEHISLNSS